MKHYIIDGNNLIGKIKSLYKIHKKNKIQSAQKLAFIIDRYFNGKKVSVSLHFDGFQNELIKTQGVKILFSGGVSADERIKEEISGSKNPRNILLVTSDNNLAEFGHVCSCQVIKSEEFSNQLSTRELPQEEDRIIEELKDVEMFKKLFGLD